MNASSVMDLVVLVAALGCGLMAGFFFAFSICVMKALGAIPPAQGISAMQSINVAVINRWFLIPYFGMAVLSLLLSIEGAALWADYLIAWTKWNHVRTIAALAGAALFTIGLAR